MIADRQTRKGQLLLAGALLLGGGHALAEEPKQEDGVASEVFVVLASEAEGAVDPSLKSVRALQQPPFNAFKSMKILSRTALSLVPEQAATVALPNGRHLQLSLLSRMPDGRYKVKVSINRPNQKDYLPLLQVVASAGEPFFVAGQKHAGGTLVIGVRVGEAKRPVPP